MRRLLLLMFIAFLAAPPVPVAAATPFVFANPGFEQGTTGWSFTSGTGVATNYPHSGSRLAYLDAGSGLTVSQTATASTAGTFDISAWLATSAAGGTLSIRDNGTLVRSVTLPAQTRYAKHTLSRIPVAAAGRAITITIGSSAGGWVNVDDIEVVRSSPNDPVITSSDPTVVAMFNWAKAKANSWVRQPGVAGPVNIDENRPNGTGTATYAATYWAGYPYRSGFYARDFAHQFVGAHILGLATENKTMLRSFARSATPAHEYYPVWAINFDANTYLRIDYNNSSSFVRELPAPFELAQRIADGHRWTGDSEYLTDPVLSGYVRNTVSSFVTAHPGPINNGPITIAQETSSDIFQGVASYTEGQGYTYAQSGDSISSQYQAYLAAEYVATAKGDTATAATYRQKAADLKAYYNSTWSVDPGNTSNVVRGYDVGGNRQVGWGYETSWFMPMKQIMDPGPRRNAYLGFIDNQSSGTQAPVNIEAISYLPDAFFANNDATTAWKWMRHVYGNIGAVHPTGRLLNGDYPEVSFTLVGQVVEGLLGVRPSGTSIATTSRLPGSIGWLQVADIPVSGGKVTLRHDGTTKSTMTNTSSATYSWEARFPGARAGITVDGVSQTVRTKQIDGATYTYATVSLPPGRSTVVQVS